MSQKDITLNGLAAYKLLHEVINEPEETEQGTESFNHFMRLVEETPNEGFGVILGLCNIISVALIKLEVETDKNTDELLREIASDVMLNM